MLSGCPFVLALAAAPAGAQVFRVGGTNNVLPGVVRGTDSAYDPANDVYLVVGAHGTTTGVFVNSSGVAVTGPFAISNGLGHAHFPRVAYGGGGFLVTWHQNIGAENYIHARRVTYPGSLGAESIVSTIDPPATSGTWWEAGPSLAYSPTSQLFLIAWQTCCGGNSVVQARPVNVNGTPVAGIQQISGGYARDPGVAWNSALNEFGISFSGADASSATTVFARTNVHGAVLRRNVFNRTTASYITDIAFNAASGRYVMAWWQGATHGAEIDAAGDALAAGLLSTTVATYDGLGLSYQPVAGTFLLVGHFNDGEVGVAELNRRGARMSNEFSVTTTGAIGMFYPRAAASTSAPRWNITASGGFAAIQNQAVGTSTTGGGTSTSLGAAPPSSGPSSPPPPPPPSGGCSGPDPFVALGGGTCVNGGWLPPSSPSNPTPPPSSGGCTTPQPASGWVCSNGGWLPPQVAPAPPPPSSSGCATPQPAAGWVCVNGGWLPPQLAPAPPPPPPSTSSCTTPQPVAGWVCVNGGWLPPELAPAAPAPSNPAPPPPSTCSTPRPVANWVCVNGGWLPPELAPTPPPTSSCSTPAPSAGWSCVNGGWLPPSHPAAPCGGTPDPFTAMGGGVCINGGWIPRTNPAAGGQP